MREEHWNNRKAGGKYKDKEKKRTPFFVKRYNIRVYEIERIVSEVASVELSDLMSL